MKTISTIICSLMLGCFGSAIASDTIIVHKDPRLDIFTEKQAYVNKVSTRMSSSGMVRGYRLQVLTTKSREDAFKTKAMLMQNFPDQKTYVLYQSPSFKVRIGNFVKRGDASNFKEILTSFYTEPVYIVDDRVEYIPGPDDDLFN